MKIVTTGVALLLSIFLQAQTDQQVVIGKADSVYSKILKENRPIWIHVPGDQSPDGVFAKKHYPVIYLLDGYEPGFSAVSSIVELLGGGGGNLSFPQMIVVGIPNTDRTRDLTPTHVSSSAMMDSASLSVTGGGEKFISFIETELIPHIDSLYSTAPYRILIGHSLGGLMSLFALVNHTRLFNAYIAIDPTTTWDDQFLVRQIHEAATRKTFADRSLFMGMANSMNIGVDTSFIGPFMRCNAGLRDFLDQHPESMLTFNSTYYPQYDHQSVPVPAEYDGLRAIFKFYNYNFPYGAFFTTGYHSDTLLINHYRDISRIMGYTVSPPEDFLNGIAHQLMSMNLLERAEYFFQKNIDGHPESFNAYDSMGDLYAKKGDKKKASEYYARSLSIHKTPETQQKLEKLKTSN
jgi:uncharacterized protein